MNSRWIKQRLPHQRHKIILKWTPRALGRTSFTLYRSCIETTLISNPFYVDTFSFLFTINIPSLLLVWLEVPFPTVPYLHQINPYLSVSNNFCVGTYSYFSSPSIFLPSYWCLEGPFHTVPYLHQINPYLSVSKNFIVDEKLISLHHQYCIPVIGVFGGPVVPYLHGNISEVKYEETTGNSRWIRSALDPLYWMQWFNQSLPSRVECDKLRVYSGTIVAVVPWHLRYSRYCLPVLILELVKQCAVLFWLDFDPEVAHFGTCEAMCGTALA